jgi:hypothetical protein
VIPPVVFGWNADSSVKSITQRHVSVNEKQKILKNAGKQLQRAQKADKI